MSATQRRLVMAPLQSVEPLQSLEPLLLPAREAFQQLGIGRDAGYQLVREGRLRAVHVSGRRILIPRSELAAFVEREMAGEPQR